MLLYIYILKYILFLFFELCLISAILKKKLFKLPYNIEIFYILQLFLTSFFLHFKKGQNFFILLLEHMRKNIILKDPQEILYVLLDMSLKLNMIFFFFFSLIFIYIKGQKTLRKEEIFLLKFSLFLFFYFLILTIILFFFDLNAFH
jgi:hypothetical protein